MQSYSPEITSIVHSDENQITKDIDLGKVYNSFEVKPVMT